MQGRTQTGLRGGQPIYDEFKVQPGGIMKSKDYFRFRTQIDKDAHVYIIFQDSTGQIQAMEKGFIFGGKAFLVPEGDKWFQLDQTTGTEKIYLIASEDEIKEFNKKINELKKDGLDNINTIFPKSTIQTFSFQHQ